MTDPKKEWLKGLMQGLEDIKASTQVDIEHHTFKANFISRLKEFISIELQKFEQSIESCP